MFNNSEANKCVGSKPAVAIEEGMKGMDGGEGWKSSGGEKVVVVEGGGRVEEKKKEKLKSEEWVLFGQTAKPQSAEQKVATYGLSRLSDGDGKGDS